MRIPHYFAIQEDEEQINALYSKDRISQLIDFLKDNTSDDLQKEIKKVFDTVSFPQMDLTRKYVQDFKLQKIG